MRAPKDSIDELKYYRRAIFVQQGPDAIASAQIAREVEAERAAREAAEREAEASTSEAAEASEA